MKACTYSVIYSFRPVNLALLQGTRSSSQISRVAKYDDILSIVTSSLISVGRLDNSGNVLESFDPQVRNTIDMPEEYWNAIHLGMKKVVEGKKYFNDLAVNVAGKTGTAEQIASRANHALFVGYAPYENPELAFTVRIPFGYSSDYAAQVAREIVKYYYGLAAEEDILSGTADVDNDGVSTDEF